MAETITPEQRKQWREMCESGGDLCHRCQGSGALYADGKAHYFSENADVVRCPVCGGEGRVIAPDSLAEALPACLDYIDALEAIVAKLPHFADGPIMYHNDRAWTFTDTALCDCRITWLSPKVVLLTPIDAPVLLLRRTDNCYSTREAALAAKERQEAAKTAKDGEDGTDS